MIVCVSSPVTVIGEVDFSKHAPPEVFIFPTPRQAAYGVVDIDLTGATIVVSEHASQRIRVAAEDLNASLLQIAPKAKPLAIAEKVPADQTTVILLGTAGAHKLLDQQLAASKIYMSASEPGPEGYRIMGRPDGNRKIVLLAGSDDQGAYWAMTSFVQLLRVQPDGEVHAYSADIRDWPGFRIRMTAIQTDGQPQDLQLQRVSYAIRLKTNVSSYSGYDAKVNAYCRDRGFKTGRGYWTMQGIGRKAQELNLPPNSWSDPRLLQAWVDAYKAEACGEPGHVIYHDCTDAGWWNRYINDYWNKRNDADKKAYPQAHPARADADRVNAIHRGVKSVNPAVDVYITVPCYYDSPQNDALPNVESFRDYLRTLGRLTPKDIYWVLEDRSPLDCAGYRHYLGGTVVNYKYPTTASGTYMWGTTFTSARDNAGYTDAFWYCVGNPQQALMFAGGAQYMWNPDLPTDQAYLTEVFIPQACKYLFGSAWREVAQVVVNQNPQIDVLAESRIVSVLKSEHAKMQKSVELLHAAKNKIEPHLTEGKLFIEGWLGAFEPVAGWLDLRILVSEVFSRVQKAEAMVALGQSDQVGQTIKEADSFLGKIDVNRIKRYEWLDKEYRGLQETLGKLRQSIASGKAKATGIFKLDGPWSMKPDAGNHGLNEKWFAEQYSRHDWAPITVPGYWDKSGIPGMTNYDGYGWYARTFCAPADWKGKSIIVHFDAVDDEAWVYVNGTLVGDHTLKNIPQQVCWEQPFEFDITDLVRWDRDNTLVVRVNDVKLDGGIWKSVWLRSDKPGRVKEGPGLVEIKDVTKDRK